MDYSKLLDWSPPGSGYAALSGGVNAWGLGGMGAVKRGGFGTAGGLGTAQQWFDSAAILDADFLGGRFRFDGVTYNSETPFLTAAGGSKSGSQRTIGPYVDPAATELITNGTFDTDLTGWTTVLNGTSTASVVSQQARLVSDGTTGTGGGGAGIAQGAATTQDKAYRALYTIFLGTTSTRFGALTATGSGAPGGGTRALGGPYTDTISADGATSYFYAFRNGAGTVAVDSISVKECVPFKNYVQGGATFRVRGTTPAAAVGTKVAVALDHAMTADAGDRAELIYNASGELHLQVKYGGASQVDINLGAVATSTAFDVLFTVKNNEFYARLGTGLPIADTAGSLPGFGALYVGKDINGNTWDGSDLRVQVYAGGGAAQFYGLISNSLHADGDSFMGGAHSVVLPATLQTNLSRAMYNRGVGGDTMDSISARLAAEPASIKSKPVIVWDGSDNGLTTVTAYCDLLQAGLAGYSKFIIIPPCVGFGQADVSTELAVRNEMLLRWPNNVLDWRNYLTLDGNGMPVQGMYFDTSTDTTHLSQAAMDLMAAGIATKISTLGY